VTVRVVRTVVRTPEGGPCEGRALEASDRHVVGPATRAAADVLAGLEARLDGVVLATTLGDEADSLDPFGSMRTAIHRAFAPGRGTVVVQAGDRTVAAGLIEAGSQIAAGARIVALVAVDWVPAAELAVGVLLADSGHIGIGDPTLVRCGVLARAAGGLDRNPVAGALRLVRALAHPVEPVVVDRVPRDGLAWAVTLEP
jgi:hypothetical protein